MSNEKRPAAYAVEPNKRIEAVVPDIVRLLFDYFNEAGFELYAVGGCIRNAILGRAPKDWDFATSATTEEMKALCDQKALHWIPTGEAFGTLTLCLQSDHFEVTTYRVEGRYSGRAPEILAFSRNLLEDLKRRDFTMNALAYNPTTGLTDPYGGLEDIEKGIIRIIGSSERFNEDPLRILRGLRFVSELGFDLDLNTLEAMKDTRSQLSRISAERITAELDRLLVGPHVETALMRMKQSRVLDQVFPEVVLTYDFDQRHPKHSLTLFDHMVAVIKSTEPDPITRWAALFHDLGKPEVQQVTEEGIATYYGHEGASERLAQTILHRLRHAAATDEAILELVGAHMRLIEPLSRKGMKRLLNALGETQVRRLIDLSGADQFAGKGEVDSEGRAVFEAVNHTLLKEILESAEAYTVNMLAVNGKDLIAAGFPHGPLIGELKAACLDYILEHPEDNEKAKLLAWLTLNKGDALK